MVLGKEIVTLINVVRWVIIDHGAGHHPRTTTSRYNAYPATEDDTNTTLEMEHHGKVTGSYPDQSAAFEELETLWMVERVTDEVLDPDEVDNVRAKRVAETRTAKARDTANRVFAILKEFKMPSGAMRPMIREALSEMLRREFDVYLVDPSENRKGPFEP